MAATGPHYGELAALLAAFIFAWTSVFFTAAGHRLGVTLVNLLRLPGAVVCLGLTHLALTGRVWPAGLAPADQAWIGLSGIVGLAVGDSALFRSFTLVGPRRGMTVMALAPVFTVVVAWALAGERLGPQALAGIAVVIGGVILATRGRDPGGGRFRALPAPLLRTGFLLALVGAACQGLGSAFAKLGMGPGGGGVDPLGATLVRLVWATVAYWLVVLPRQDRRVLRERLRDRRGVAALAVAVLLGPFLSVWISLVAIKNTEAGVAQVFLGMVPIFVLLPSWLVYRDSPTVPTLAGVAVAVAGGALLFLR
ncbi:MAG: DMT family transporter [Candidatus Krumholzibacteriia bacterium]